jgi:hypothetical protein
MPDNNMFILAGLGMAAIWFMNRGGSQEDQVDQLAGAAMMASGEGTTPDAPFQAYSAPGNPVFFFNQGGQMTKVPGTNVPVNASGDEDIGVYPGGDNQGELEFTVDRGATAVGTSDKSPINPLFEGAPQGAVVASTVWDQQSLIAGSNFMPLLAIGDDGGGGVNILGSNVDISNLSSKEQFRATDLTTGAISGGFVTTGQVLGEYVRGFTGDYVPGAANRFDPAAAAAAYPVDNAIVISQTQPQRAAWIDETDLDLGF